MTVAAAGATAAATSSNSLGGGRTLADSFDGFLKLLATQLQQQDPMAPMDATQFTSQLVQFAQVEQSIKSNDQLGSLAGLVRAATATAAVGYIGADVTAAGSKVRLGGSGPATGFQYSLGSDAAEVQITIKDAKGGTVLTSAGALGRGAHTFAWDGTGPSGARLASGDYSVSVKALDADGETMSVDTAVQGTVEAIETRADGLYALIGGTPVPLSSITQVRHGAAATPAAT